MTSLDELQRTLQRYLTDGDESVLQLIAGDQCEERLSIYGTAYRMRLQEVLGVNFSKLHILLGDDNFEHLTRDYIRMHPSQHPNVRWFGGELAAFLDGTRPYADQPVLAEMATFEWALAKAFDAADAPCATPEDLMAVAPENWGEIRLEFHPSVQLLHLHWNVPPIWSQLEQDDEAGPDAPERSQVPVSWLMWRQRDLVQQWRSLDVDEAWAFSKAQQGSRFAEICSGLEEWIDARDLALHAAGMLKRWLTDGLVSTVRTSPLTPVT